MKKENLCNQEINCELCKMLSECKAWEAYVKTHNDVKSYAHFGKRVSLRLENVLEYVMSPSKVSNHGFYPFIHFKKQIIKFRKNSNLKEKSRDLYYCSHLDRCVYQRYAFILNQRYEKWLQEHKLDDVAIAYRNNLNKNTAYFANLAFRKIYQSSQCFILVSDFKSFFDNINHKYLKRKLLELLKESTLEKDMYNVYKHITGFSYCDWDNIMEVLGLENTVRNRKLVNHRARLLSREQLNKNKHIIQKHQQDYGIPQGSPISAVLANIYMMSFDELLNEYVISNNGLYMRYSDDIIIIIPGNSMEEIFDYNNSVTKLCDSFKSYVSLQEDKTKRLFYDGKKIINLGTNKEDQIDYLGFCFDGFRTKFRPKGITKYYYRLHRKAKNIRRCNGVTKLGHVISNSNIYNLYSERGEQNYISYLKNCYRIMEIHDPEAEAIVKHNMTKIKRLIKPKSKVDK